MKLCERAKTKLTGFVGTLTLVMSLTLIMATSALAQDVMINGGGQYDTPTEFGPVRVQVAGTGMSRDGKVRGEGTVQVFGTGYSGHYRYLCLELHENIVLDVAVFTSGNAGVFALGGLGDPETGDLTGWVFAAAVQDNGQGKGAEPDRVGGPWHFPPEYVPEDPCVVLDFPAGDTGLTVREALLEQFDENPSLPADPLLSGNFQIILK